MGIYKMRNLLIAVLLIIILAVLSGVFSSRGEKLYRQAAGLEKKADLFRAFDTYKKAKAELVKEEKIKLADECRHAFTRIEKIKLTYTFTEDKVRRMMKERFPKIAAERIDEVIKEGRLPHMKIDGKVHYFVDFMNTLNHVYPDFRHSEEAGALGKVTMLFDMMGKYLYEKDAGKKGQTLFSPINYTAESSMTLPRNKLPKEGTLRVWLPLPLVTAAQQNVRIITIYPEKYVKYPIKIDGDIGLAYMEIPLKEIKGDLKIGTKFTFTHYEERFTIDPAKIGEYDKQSALFKRYTAPGRNIAIPPSIAAKARKLAGKEKMPTG